jgi:hypothetical protein
VTNPAPGGGTADRVWFTIIGGTNPVPTINSLDSSEAPVVGGQAFTLTVYGLNFVAGSVVRWNGSDRPTTLVISWCCGPLLTAQIPASDIAAAGTAAVTVFNPAPGGGSSNPTGMAAVNCVALTNEVVRAVPPKLTIEPATKFAPLTVSVKGAPLPTALFGEIVVIVGTGFVPLGGGLDPLGGGTWFLIVEPVPPPHPARNKRLTIPKITSILMSTACCSWHPSPSA